jgi:hypothetical protein
MIAQCTGDPTCIGQRQIQEIAALRAAGAPLSLPSSPDQGSSSGISTQQFQLTGDSRWVIYASRQDRAEAIDIAHKFTPIMGPMRVFSTTNGWYAVAAGPVDATSPDELRQRMGQEPNAPKDAFLSTGKTFIEQIWQTGMPGDEEAISQLPISPELPSGIVATKPSDETPKLEKSEQEGPTRTPVIATSPDTQQHSTWLIYLCAFAGLYFLVRLLRYMSRRKHLIKKYGRDVGLRILSRHVWQGMTSEQLLDSWGKPIDIDREVYKTKTKETWKYNQTGKNRFNDRIYLNDGIVVGWKD